MNVVANKWVYRIKRKADGTLDRLKARLVAKGFQQTAGVDFFETFSPVVKAPTVRVVLTLAMTYGWQIQQIDINNAFLNGGLKETVYMKQPDGFQLLLWQLVHKRRRIKADDDAVGHKRLICLRTRV